MTPPALSPGLSVDYYHAFLDETIPARVQRVTKGHIVIDLGDWAEFGAPRTRKLTRKRASECLTITEAKP